MARAATTTGRKASPRRTATTKASAKKATPSKKKASTNRSARKSATKTNAKAAPAAKAAKKKARSRPKAASKRRLDSFQEGQLNALEAERTVYLRQAESLQAEADSLTEDREPGDVQFDEESGEGDSLAVERERDLALSHQARSAIEEIDLAISKIHDGTYGQCASCGARIPKERLKALPYAVLCVRCKSGGLGLGR